MAENTRINLGLNTQASVDPELSVLLNPNHPNPAPWRGSTAYAGAFAYTSLRYAPDLGPWGSIVGTIGGHGGYFGNEVVRFDIDTRLFTPLSDPYTSLSHPGSFFANGSGTYSDNTNGEFHTTAGLATDQTQPGACHAYAHNLVLPPDSATGVGANGALISLVRAARSSSAGGGTADRTHIFDLAQSNRATAAWARYATNLFAPTEAGKTDYQGWAVYDTSRKKVYAGIESGPFGGADMDQLKVLNCVTKQWESQLVLSESIYQYHSGAWHWTNNPDYIINFFNDEAGGTNGGTPISLLEIIHIPTGTVYRPGTTGTRPQLVGGYDWVQSQNKMVLYEGGVTSDGGGGVGFPNRVWILTPPHPGVASAFTTMPWTWSFEDVTGPTPPIQSTALGTIPHIGRFLWCDKVKGFISWMNGTDNVQFWRVRGFG